MNAKELRETYLRFFEEKNHRRIPSAPLLPDYDPQETWVYRLAHLNPGRALCIVDQSSAHISCQP